YLPRYPFYPSHTCSCVHLCQLHLHDTLPICPAGALEAPTEEALPPAHPRRRLRLPDHARRDDARHQRPVARGQVAVAVVGDALRSEEHTSELQSRFDLVCRLLREKTQNSTTQ